MEKSVSVKLSNGALITGFVAIREKASTSQAGFSLFRRKRLIEGSDDEKKRPAEIFGKPNTYIYQRLFGEIHMNGFDVSHTKDSFNFLDYEEEIYEKLKDLINEEPIKLLKQAREYRVNKISEQSEINLVQSVHQTTQSISKNSDEIKSQIIDPSKQNNFIKQFSATFNNNPLSDIKPVRHQTIANKTKIKNILQKENF